MPVASAARSAGFDRGEVQRAAVSLQTEIKSNNCCHVVAESFSISVDLMYLLLV